MEEKIKKALAGLKDFQLSTVDYVYEQLYSKGRDKMLIADEVGLGKTIVAKGIIAKAYLEFLRKPNPDRKSFKVVYVCSNQALASQNLKKLNFTDDERVIDYSREDDRLTALAYEPAEKKDAPPFQIKAFTPATSFDDKTHAGRVDERVLLYRLLHGYQDFAEYQNSLKWLLKGNKRIKEDTWEFNIDTADDKDKKNLRSGVATKFKRALEDELVHPDDPQLAKAFEVAEISQPIRYWTLLRKLCELQLRKNNYSKYDFYRRLISSLRFRLSLVCAEFLQADIFILDEFQRYKQLIENATENNEESPAVQLAKLIFKSHDSKVLMLSATPFKPYTNDFDSLNGEVHYEEFQTVLKFLLGEKSPVFWEKYIHDRKTLFSFLRHPQDLEQKIDVAINLKENLENVYRQGMVRTERLLAARDRDSLIRQEHTAPISISSEDIRDFVDMDKVTQALNEKSKWPLPIPIEYVKSCPFPWSFLDNYLHKDWLREVAKKDPALRRLLKQNRNSWLNLDDINLYRPLIPKHGKRLPNAKLRQLLELTVHNGGWQYLWIPPSLPYYVPDGAFKECQDFSKTLIFSSWKMVPRMVASLVSYEAERLSVGALQISLGKENKGETNFYFQKKRLPRPQFTFKVEREAGPQQMNNFMLAYPSTFLATRFDPMWNTGKDQTHQDLVLKWKNEIIKFFHALKLNDQVTGLGREWQKWYWLAPLLFDKFEECPAIAIWLSQANLQSEINQEHENLEEGKAEHKGRIEHFRNAAAIVLGGTIVDAPKLTDDQLEKVCTHLAELALGSPANCHLRTQLRHFEMGASLLHAARDVGYTFLSLFNKPESIAILRILGKRSGNQEEEYWRQVLHYSIEGNIQAMLDEFVYLLIHSENQTAPEKVRDHLIDVLSVRTTRAEIDGLKEFIDGLDHMKTKRKKSIRTHYAAEFGNQKLDTAGRQIHIREAFNSPFRPFVLATTSIGQEGLDFHFYCRRIFHWNLPSNPIDFEQREGRIHRYKGLVIRRNLAQKYGHEIQGDKVKEVWEELFLIAGIEKKSAAFPCDLVPFWHTESHEGVKIERIVPLYPLSRDIEKFRKLKSVLAHYRLTFGQPRQEELVESLSSFGFTEDGIKSLDRLIINLSPISFLRTETGKAIPEVISSSLETG